MSNWFGENIAKLATAWQAAFLFVFFIFNLLYAELGISIVDKWGAIILLLGGFILIAYLYTVSMVFKNKDKQIDVTPKELFTIKQAVSLIEDTFGLKPKSAFVPIAEPEVDIVTRAEFKELYDTVLRALEAIKADG